MTRDTLIAAGEQRIVVESGIDARIAAIVEPVLEALGYRLVRVRLSGQDGQTLQIMAERDDGTMTVEDCEEVSRVLSPVLDVEDPVAGAYNLEISSPGIDRPLVRRSDFSAWSGHLAKVETAVLIGERKRFRGTIGDVGDAAFVIERDKAAYGDEPQVTIPFDAVAEARLVLTDELIRDALKADKKARRARRKERGGESGADAGMPPADTETE